MLNIFETGDDSFRLADEHDVNVGWVRGSALGFDGFATEADAVAATLAGSEALAGYLERLTGAKPEAGAGRVRVAKDGADEWVVRGAARLARLYRPGGDEVPDRRRETFGVEFALPSYVRPGAAISAAQVLRKAIVARAAAPAVGKKSAAAKAPAKGATPPSRGTARGGALSGLGGDRLTPADGVGAR